MKSGNLNFLEPSGPLQACNGTVLSLLKALGPYSTTEHANGANVNLVYLGTDCTLTVLSHLELSSLQNMESIYRAVNEVVIG
jgi:hypothetical protein